MKSAVVTSIGVFGGILLILGGILFWQNQKVEAPALREESTEEIFQKEEVAMPLEEEVSSEKAAQVEQLPEAPVETEPKTTASVSTLDCENECSAYTDPETLKYCKALCGLEAPAYQDKDCEGIAPSEKDFCYKEEAVRKQDGEICAKIKDVKLRKTCEARIAEDLF
ncbi:MAG: hypothetical protein KIH67_000120 [Candidatus Moranbacteria bacterium]|nr:hypothetical protein [Candidatus Moranbacteria bacterium]